MNAMSFVAYRYRLKDASSKRHLERHARACNTVWNFCVATQRETQRRYQAGRIVRWPTAFDLIRLVTGSSAELGIHSDTISAICRQFAASRDQHRRCPRFRSSFGAKSALGWVPFIPRAVKVADDTAIYLKRCYRFWQSRETEGEFKAGAFVQDARGRWYVTFLCEVSDDRPAGDGIVGIDLGLKSLATLSTGETIPALQHYRKYEAALATAQRARNRRRVAAIHAKIANSRRHHLHEQSTRIARENKFIVVGDVSASKLAKTKMAKSVLDASWSSFRHMLRYKAARRQAVYVDVSERYSSQVCSACGCLPASRPRGIADLGIRLWICDDCGTTHDRDVNAARNILRVGLECQAPAGEIPVL
jgi:IS605 OrfB family transposase